MGSHVHATRIHQLLCVHVLDRALLGPESGLAAFCGGELCRLTVGGDHSRTLRLLVELDVEAASCTFCTVGAAGAAGAAGLVLLLVLLVLLGGCCWSCWWRLLLLLGT